MKVGLSISGTGATPGAQHHLVEWCSLLDVLCVTPALAGRPGALSPELAAENGGAGNGAGGGGAGGSNPCTGLNDGATLIMANCANLYCHSPGGDGTDDGLDITVDATLPQLSNTQQGCIEQWAEGLVMAAAQ